MTNISNQLETCCCYKSNSFEEAASSKVTHRENIFLNKELCLKGKGTEGEHKMRFKRRFSLGEKLNPFAHGSSFFMSTNATRHKKSTRFDIAHRRPSARAEEIFSGLNGLSLLSRNIKPGNETQCTFQDSNEDKEIKYNCFLYDIGRQFLPLGKENDIKSEPQCIRMVKCVSM